MTNFQIEILEVAPILIALWVIIKSVLTGFLNDVIKFILNYIKSRILYTFTCNTDHGGDYNYIMEWLAENLIDKFPNTTPHSSSLTNQLILVPGFGLHFLRYNGSILMLNHHKELDGQDSVNTLTISTFFFWKKAVVKFLEDVSNVNYSKEDENISIYYLHDHNWGHTYKLKRELEHFYLKEETKNEINADFEWFIKNKEFYKSRGIPWNHGYKFEGPPGSGKTTLAFILAGKYNLPIYFMNLNSVSNDDYLNILFMQMNFSSNAIVLIEDIDTFKVAKDRELRDNEEDDRGVSLSGLLNAIDGILAREGKIVVMTTNHPDQIDPALVRWGRIDKTVEIGLLCPKETARMFCVFFPLFSHMSDRIEKFATDNLKVAAEWQSIFIENQSNPENIFKALNK